MPDSELQRHMAIMDALGKPMPSIALAGAVIDFDDLGDEFCRRLEAMDSDDTVLE